MVCLLPISLLSKVLVPWAEELGEVTTEADAAPPGDDTMTDASLEEEIPLLDLDVDYDHTNPFLVSAFGAHGITGGTGANSNVDCADYVAKAIYGYYTEQKHEGFPALGHFLTGSCTVVSKVTAALDENPYFSQVYANSTLYSDLGGSGYNQATANLYNTAYKDHTKSGDIVVFVYQFPYSNFTFVHIGICGGNTSLIYQSPSHGWGSYDAGWYIANSRYTLNGNNLSSPLVYQDKDGYRKALTGMFVYRHVKATDSSLRVCKMPYYGGANVESLVANNPKYNTVKGAVYAIYSDNTLRNVVGYCIQDDDNDNVSTNMKKTPDVNGEEVKITSNGTYYLKETKAPDNGVMALSNNVYSFYVDVTKGRHTIGVPYSFKTRSKLNLVSSQPGVYNENPTLVSGTNHNQPGIIDDANYGHVALKKTSSNPTCTNNNPLYDLSTTTYTVYDAKTNTVAKTVSGNAAILVCDRNGNTATLEMPLGSYYAKETKPGKGYLKNEIATPTFELTAAHTADNPYVINTTDKPVDDPIYVALTKTNNSNVPIKGAVYCVEYYPGVQTYSESEAQTKHTGSVSKWYFETDANGKVNFQYSSTASGYNSSPFFTDLMGIRTIPLGTVVMYEEKAPDNYTKSPTHWIFQVRQAGDGRKAWLYGMEGGTEKRYDNGTTVSDTNAPKFSDTPIPVNLTVQKKNGNPTPQQGSTGDITLEGAVFGLYVKRDIVDESTGETKVKAENYSVDTPLTHSDGTPVIDPTTGKQVIAKAGTAKAIRISAATGKDGKISFNDLFPAKNADDYYVVELCAPKDFYTDVSIFETNDEGFLLLFEAFKYGEYTIVEEEAPTGYDKNDNITFSVRQDGVYLWANNQWVKATTYSNKVGDTEYDFWEVDFYDAPFSLEIAKADWETGDWVPNAELTIYKAMDKAGHIAIGEDGKPVVLVARDESGKDVEAVWITSAGIKRFDKVPSGWYVIRETKTPTQEGYATCPDRVVYVGNDETIAPNGKMTISGDETVYFSFTYDDDGVTIADVPEYEADTKNGKVALYDKPITVEISKIDAATEKELPGAVLTLYRVDEDEDTVIETWTSTETSHVVKYLTPGRYKLHEDTVPLGYYTTQNTIEFDVSDSEEIQKCVMVNHPIEVTFDKQSINLGGTSLPGATLALYRISEGPAFATASDASSSDATVSDASNSDAKGLQLVERWVTDGKPHTIKYLTPGDYRLIEEKTPEGYTTAASIDFSISDQKAAEAIVMYDEPIKCYVQIFKHGEMLTTTEIVECEYGKYTKFKWEDAPMSQVSFDVYDENDNLVDTIVTNENGTGVSKDLAFGSYKIKERVPDGWVDKHVVYNVKFTWLQGMTETNLTASVTVNNESCNTQININKVGEEAVLNSKGEYEYVDKPLKGVLFGIYAKDAIKDYSGKEIAAADTCVGYAVTDSNGIASCDSKLVRGEYYYKELKTAGPQYVMDEDLHPFTLILANSKISTFNVNETLPIKNVLARGNIKVLKVNKDGRAPLTGAEFDVFNADGIIVDHLVTGTDGTATTKVLPYGKYSLRETKAPTGFVLSKATFDTEIIANGDVPLLEITNSTITKLGSKGIFIVVSLAVIFAGLVTVICFKLRRK